MSRPMHQKQGQTYTPPPPQTQWVQQQYTNAIVLSRPNGYVC